MNTQTTVSGDYERQRLTDLISLLETSIAEMRATLAAYQPVENKFDSVHRQYYEGLIWTYEQMLAPLQQMRVASDMVNDFVSQFNLRN